MKLVDLYLVLEMSFYTFTIYCTLLLKKKKHLLKIRYQKNSISMPPVTK